MSVRIPVSGALRGRGAVSNRSGRFETLTRADLDDGWGLDDADRTHRADTVVATEAIRTIIARNDSPDIGFAQSINPYRGCEHGCVYCYARPAHAYVGLSPGLDFETRIFAKPDAASVLEKELRRDAYVCERIHIGANTDPYQPAERRLRITRSILEVLDRFNHPLSIITKNALIERDADLLGAMAARNLAGACISVTSLDARLARAMEPRASTPARRLKAMETLARAGVPVMVGFAPVIPGLNDHEMERVLKAAADAGATRAMYVVLRLPLEIKDLFHEWLDAAVPDRAARIRSLTRQMRAGRDYDPQWGSRMKGEGPIAELLRRRFVAACERLKLNQKALEVDASAFRRPPAPGDQLSLLPG